MATPSGYPYPAGDGYPPDQTFDGTQGVLQNTEWPRTTRVLVVTGLILALVATLIFARALIPPIVTALLLSYIINPVVTFFERRTRIKRGMLVNIIIVLLVLVVISVPATAGTIIVTRLTRLEIDFQAFVADLERTLTQPFPLAGFVIEPPAVIESFDLTGTLSNFLRNLPGRALNILGLLGSNFLWIVFVLGALHFFLSEGPNIRQGLVEIVPHAYQPEWARLLDEINEVWNIFFWGQIVVFLIMLIPTVGSVYLVYWLWEQEILRVSVAGLIAAMIGVYLFVQQIDQIWLRPYLFGETLKIPFAIVLIALIGGLMVGGAIGAVIAVPLIASLRITLGYIHRKLLGRPPWPEEEGQIELVPDVDEPTA